MTSVLADGTTQQARYDADSHLLELRTSDAAGALVSVETDTWQEGLELRSRVDRANGEFSQLDWTYDSQRHLKRVLREDSFVPYQEWVDVTYDYDDQSRLSKKTSHYVSYDYDGHGGLVSDDHGNPIPRWPSTVVFDYSYDAQGRLVSIEPDAESYSYYEEHFSYGPDGRLKSHQVATDRSDDYVDEYNQLGQIIHTTRHMDEGLSESTQAYDATGRLLRRRLSGCFGAATQAAEELLDTTVYDPGGWRERLASDSFDYSFSAYCLSHNWGHDSFPLPERHQRITHRTTLLCNTQIIALDEWDIDEDGIVDARRTHERDSTGRLVHEEYSGPPGLDNDPVRRDFRYDCP